MAPRSKTSTLTAKRKAMRSEADFIRSLDGNSFSSVKTTDSFQNFVAKMGVGTDNQTSFSTYGFNPITRIRILLEWIYRGSWIGGTAVNVVAEDMTRGGVSFKGDMKQEDVELIEELATQLRIWEELRDGVSWGRLYGGAITVMLVDGQNLRTPLRVETVGEGQFKGLITLDRWMIEPSLNDLVTDFGPFLGMPKYYRITDAAPALRGQVVHYSRCLRFEGIRLPYNQRMMENLWGISVLERLYDRMIAFDSATQGAAQLIYKSYVRTYGVEDLRENISAGGDAMDGVVKYVNMMARFQSVEGVTLIDAKDRMEADATGASAIVGVSDALNQFAGQLSGALGIPLVRLFGQSPAGFSTGDTDLRNYYDTIKLHQKSVLLIPVTNMYKCLAQSLGIEVPDGFGIEFNPLWQLSESDKAGIAQTVTSFVTAAQEQGTIDRPTALKELSKSSKETGYWGHIDREQIAEAEKQAKLAPPLPTGVLEAETRAQGQEESAEIKSKTKGGRGESPEPETTPPSPKTKDGRGVALKMFMDHGIEIVIENPAGSVRSGAWGSAVQPDDYGYIRRVMGVDGDPLDCYVGHDVTSNYIYVIDQRNLETGEFDEHKCMIGYSSRKAAEETYDLAYPDGYGMARIMQVRRMNIDEFKDWMKGGNVVLPLQDKLDDTVTMVRDGVAFRETEHPRRKDGEFAPKGSGGGSSKSSVKVPAAMQAGYSQDRTKWPVWARKMVVPPAWTDIHIAKNPKSALLITGVDKKGRRQFIYSQDHQQSQSLAKFQRVKELSAQITRIEKQIDSSIKSDVQREHEHGICAKLIFTLGLRPGSTADTKADKKAYGATTLEGRHISTKGSEVNLIFIGKKGVQIHQTVTDPQLASWLRKRKMELDSYDRVFPTVSGSSMARYSRELGSGDFMTKDFRTHKGTSYAAQLVDQMKAPTNLKEYKKKVNAVGDAVSKALGNTRAVALKAYIAPQVFTAWRESAGV